MDNIYQCLKRIKTSPDGQDFIDYLKELSIANYEAFKRDTQDMNDIHKGYGIAIDSLMEAFEICDAQENKETIQEHWN